MSSDVLGCFSLERSYPTRPFCPKRARGMRNDCLEANSLRSRLRQFDALKPLLQSKQNNELSCENHVCLLIEFSTFQTHFEVPRPFLRL